MASFGKTPPSGKLTFPCTECSFEAQSQRQLSRHKAVNHTQNALKCVLCPFVTAYQTNLLRHRKDVHGICGSKGNKSCKFCGFVSEDNDTLIHHQIEFHQDILKSAQVKFAKELVSAGGDESIADFSASFETMSGELFNGRSLNLTNHNNNNNNNKKPRKMKAKSKDIHHHHQQQQQTLPPQQLQQQQQQHHASGGGMSVINSNHNNNGMMVAEANEFDDFWKAGFMDNYDDPSIYFNHQTSFGNVDSQNESVNTSRSSTPKSQSSHNLKDLPATRIRRQYTCNDCGFRTVNPREFLYHRRDGHGHKIKIVECPYCVYACQYVQKLQRHLLLVHKLQTMMTPSGEPITNGDGDSMIIRRKYKKFKQDFDGSSMLLDNDISSSNFEPDINMDEDNQSLNDEDFEHMNNFEMNFNEYHNNIDCKESDKADDDKEDEMDDSTQMVNLECSICRIKFGDIVSAQKHFLRNHKYSDAKQIMSIHKNDSSPIQMTTSQRKVFDTMKNVHSCNYCGYKTRWISELERHVRVHSKEKPFKCPFCDFKSKWKGDLNRHVQRYHSSEPGGSASGDLESDTSANYTGNSHNLEMSTHIKAEDQDSLNHFKGSFMPGGSGGGDTGDDEDYPNGYECSMEMDDSVFTSAPNALNENSTDNFDVDNEENTQSPSNSTNAGNSNTAKMYKCTYCDFMCSTASRFHVHYVQHLNTKPFQCSICGHRSNWEWDVTKHIKMKAQRDPNHEKARPVLIHDSGKRDYSKYNKFVVWVGQAEAEMANNEANKIDFRAKRFRTEAEEPEAEENSFAMDNLLMPEVCFEVDGETTAAAGDGPSNANNNSGHDSGIPQQNSPHKSRMSLLKTMGSGSTRSVVARSVIVSRHSNSRNRLIHCAECNFKHQFARVMVAHQAHHFHAKPYKCKHCPFESNWREVLINHNRTEHKRSESLDFDMRFRCVIDEHSTCRIVAMEELDQVAMETSANGNELFEPPSQPHHIIEPNSSLIEPNIYEEKAVIRCELCPFLTTNLKKMTIHCRFHNPSKGSLKCKYCPYFVNNKDKLMRHQKLHQKIGISSHTFSGRNRVSNLNDTTDDSYSNFGHQAQPISCSLCSFRAANIQSLSEHMKIHDTANADYEHEFNESLLEQSMQEKSFGETANIHRNNQHQQHNSSDEGLNATFGNDQTENSVSLIDVNNMKNGTAKKFSYVCPDCPAAFKSPGDYKIHAVFHSSNYQHSCPYCTYKARNKPQLCKHLYVHTAEYIAKRANSYPDGTKHLVGNQDSNSSNALAQEIALTQQKLTLQAKQQKATNTKTGRKHRTKIEFPMKPVKVKLNSEENGKQKIVFNNTDLMASQEFLETKEYLQRINSGIKNRCMYRCSTCPAVFTKVNTLIYHMTLHEQKAQFTCDSCTYSTATEDNLSIHSLLHNLTESQAALGYNFNYNCHKCPAGFSKRTRLDKHLSLHGAKFNWKCDKCDYSVRYAATLVKHRALHLINPNFRALENASGENGESHLLDKAAQELMQPNIKMKLNLNKVHSDGMAATSDDDDEQHIMADNLSDNAADEDISGDNCDEEEDVRPPEEDEEAEDVESFDGIPEVVMFDEEEDDDDDAELVDNESINELAIEAK